MISITNTIGIYIISHNATVKLQLQNELMIILVIHSNMEKSKRKVVI